MKLPGPEPEYRLLLLRWEDKPEIEARAWCRDVSVEHSREVVMCGLMCAYALSTNHWVVLADEPSRMQMTLSFEML